MILTHPTDRTVFSDNDAVFSSVTRDSSTTYWRLNGTDYDDLPSDVQFDLIISSTSTDLEVVLIIARAKYNGTRVECVAENNDGDSIVSDTATLYIYTRYINTEYKSITR